MLRGQNVLTAISNREKGSAKFDRQQTQTPIDAVVINDTTLAMDFAILELHVSSFQ